MARKPKLVPVRIRAVVGRVNRLLAKEGTVLKKTKGETAREGVGEYYILDLNSNSIRKSNIDLEKTARDLGALAEWETLVEE